MATKQGSGGLKWLIVVSAIIAVAAGGLWYFKHEAADAPQYQTTTVTRGDLMQAVTAAYRHIHHRVQRARRRDQLRQPAARDRRGLILRRVTAAAREIPDARRRNHDDCGNDNDPLQSAAALFRCHKILIRTNRRY